MEVGRVGVFLGAVSVALLLVTASAAEAAPQWLTPGQTVSGPNGTIPDCSGTCPPDPVSYLSAAYPQVAMDGQGNLTALYGVYDTVSKSTKLMTSGRPAGGSWDGAATLASAENPSTGRLASNSRGDAVAAWFERTATSQQAQAAVRSAGGSFGAPQTISLDHVFSVPAVAIDPAGDAVVAWDRFDGSTFKVEVATRQAGGAFPSSGTAISADGATYPPAVAMDPQGDALVVWTRKIGFASYIVEARFRPAGGAFGPTQQMSPTGADGAPSVAMDNQGDAAALWSQQSGSSFVEDASFRPAGGSFPSAGTQISGLNVQGQSGQVGMDSQGDAVALWSRDQGSSQFAVESSYRPAGGSFPSTGAKLSGTDSLPELPELAVDAEGNAYAVWTRTDSSTSPATHNLEASARPAGGSFATPVTLESVNGTTGSPLSPQVAADGLGDAAAVWTDSHNSTESVLATGYDGAGPQLRNLSVPSRGTVGHPLGFSVSPVDVWSSLASTRWNFGDGSTANGASVIHTYNRAGIFNVSVTSTDSLGNSSTATGTVTVPAGPSLSSVSMLRRVFAVGPKPTAISARAGRRKAPRGTAFRYRLSAPATVRIEIRLQLPGRKTRRGCVKPTRKLRHKQKCSRYVTVGTLIRHDPAGANSTAFSGRIGRRALRPGSYLAILAASNAAGVSQPKRLSFRIVRA